MRKQSALISKIAAKEAATRATATIVSTMVVPAERLLDMASAIVIEIIAAIVPTGPKSPLKPTPAEAKAPTTTVSGLTKVVSRPLRRGRSIAFLQEANALFFRSRRICVPCPFHPQQPT